MQRVGRCSRNDHGNLRHWLSIKFWCVLEGHTRGGCIWLGVAPSLISSTNLIPIGVNMPVNVSINFATTDTIRSWSYGEVTNHKDTINFLTGKPAVDGLFCQRIFGPVKNHECECKKYQGYQHDNVICEKCGVQVGLNSMRRERMGHIELACPVTHIWTVKIKPSRLAIILDIHANDLEKLVYYSSYIAMEDFEGKSKGNIVEEEEYMSLVENYGIIPFKSGAPAILDFLQSMNVEKEIKRLRKSLETEESLVALHNMKLRLKTLEDFQRSGNTLDSLILTTLPVLPPDIRPLMSIDNGRYASTDLNDLYRRILIRNNRLKKIEQIRAPDIIIRNERRMLQQAVDCLLDNERSRIKATGSGNRQLKSLTQNLTGKGGRFRSSMLGKRVDYSGRSVIVIGPNLKLHECGLPKQMALELFNPLVINEILHRDIVPSAKAAKFMIDNRNNIIWDVLSDVVKDHPILLNRAPTLHRLGMQAFIPRLISGRAIQLHPLVCSAFNADFDGDEMAVHIPLTKEAVEEAKRLMLATTNILSPANGKPIVAPSFDVVLGMYWLSLMSAEKAQKNFAHKNDAISAYDREQITLHDSINVRITGKRVQTTVGRMLIWEVLPDQWMPFEEVNKLFTKADISKFLNDCYKYYNKQQVVQIIDKVKNLGIRYSTKAGLSIGLPEFQPHADKIKEVHKAYNKLDSLEQEYQIGLHDKSQKRTRTLDIWAEVDKNLSVELEQRLTDLDEVNTLKVFLDSGARGSVSAIKQISLWRGLMQGADGIPSALPVISSFQEGLTIPEFMLSSYGARKAAAKSTTSISNAGYFTRRIVDATTPIIIREHNCETREGMKVQPTIEGSEQVVSLVDKLKGRVVAEDIINPTNEKVIVEANNIPTQKQLDKIAKLGLDKAVIRSPVTCENTKGICSLCYGLDLSTKDIAKIGEPVGIIAAHSIGEPGTQGQLNTVKAGGATSRMIESGEIYNITAGLVKVESLKYIASVTEKEKNRKLVLSQNTVVKILHPKTKRMLEEYSVPYGAYMLVRNNNRIKKGTKLAYWKPNVHPIICQQKGWVQLDMEDTGAVQELVDEITGITSEYTVVRDSDEKGMPTISLLAKDEETEITKHVLPENTLIYVKHDELVKPGRILAEIPTQEEGVQGQTLENMFEGRVPQNKAMYAMYTGVLDLNVMRSGRTTVRILDDDEEILQKTTLPAGTSHALISGIKVKRGDILIQGVPDPNDLLELKGVKKTADYLLEWAQASYRIQGVDIDNKHLEIVIRRMTDQVEVLKAGDSPWLEGDRVNAVIFYKTRNKLAVSKKESPECKRLLLGITKAALRNDSFVSAASFQETSKVLLEAAFNGKVDPLIGIKESVIFNKRIPAGTGYRT